MKQKLLLPILAILSALLLTGCEVGMTNLTRSEVPQNPSGIYTLGLKAVPKNANIEKASFKPYIVINGQKHPMQKGDMGPDTFEYDYKMPLGANRARYYYLVEYKVKNQDTQNYREAQSELYDLTLVNRYVSEMQSNRGLVGSTIPVTGRGFTEFDTILVDDVEAETQYVSPNVLLFKVPPLPGNKIYDVELKGDHGISRIGEFRVDAAAIRVNKSRVDLKEGQRSMLVLQIDEEAPKSGLEVDVTTDVPESVIMPEAIIPGGARTVSVMVEGGKPGHGNIFFAAPGYQETAIPVEVTEES